MAIKIHMFSALTLCSLTLASSAVLAGGPEYTVEDCHSYLVAEGFEPSDFSAIYVGTGGDDMISDYKDVGDNSDNNLDFDEAFCGFNGNDSVPKNRGVFFGGNGEDHVGFNLQEGKFYGGNNDDDVSFNGVLNPGSGDNFPQNPVFKGGNGNDSVGTNNSGATFIGGNGKDDCGSCKIDSSFEGKNGKDSVNRLEIGAYFHGGRGRDSVDDDQGGDCVKVEVGCGP